MQRFSEIKVLQVPIIMHRSGGFVVVCVAHMREQAWCSAREYYLHRCGEWGIFPVSDDGDTGFYESREKAEAALRAATDGAPITHVEGNVHHLNMSAWSACARVAKRMRA